MTMGKERIYCTGQEAFGIVIFPIRNLRFRPAGEGSGLFDVAYMLITFVGTKHALYLAYRKLNNPSLFGSQTVNRIGKSGFDSMNTYGKKGNKEGN